MPRSPLLLFVPRLFAMVLALCGAAALGQTDPPGRVGRLNHAEGTVTFSPAGDNEWTDAVLNRPLIRGDRLWTDRKSRAEVQIGSSAVRLDGQTHVEILALDDRAAQLSLTQGTVYVRVRSLPEGENFEIDTPNLAYRAGYPGDYRIDVDPADGTTRVTIHSGNGAVYGEGGHAMTLSGGQQITFRARSLAQVMTHESPPQDAFDRWAAERNRREDQSISARYVPREVVGYQHLDAHGQWKKEPAYGAVWYPQGMPAGWAPYRHGHWEWISPWGWNWIDDAPWGFAPFHYGRWALVDSRWGWVPGRLGPRPIYAPALVAFIGGAGDGVLASVSSRAGIAWFPLAPGEMWQPGFRASAAYISNVNLNMVPGASDAAYAYQRRPEALTGISGDDFQRGRPVGAGWLRVAAHTLTNAGIVPPPPKPEPTRMAARDKPATAKAAPPAPSDVRPVVATAGAAAASGARDAAAVQQRKAEQQAKSVEQAAQRRQAAEQAQAAAQAAAAAEQARRGEQARKVEQARQTRQAALEQARAAQQAKAAHQARLAEQARSEQQAKAAQQARLAETARVEQQRRLAERARRAEQARSEELAQQSKAARRTQRVEPPARESVARTAPARGDPAASRAEASKQSLAVRAEPSRREQARNADRARREQAAVRTEQARLEQLARREPQAKRADASRREAQARRDERASAQARRTEQVRRDTLARREEQAQRETHARRVEQTRRSADRDAQALREQRLQREAQERRDAQERELAAREQAQREAWQRQQQTIAEQNRRDQQAWELQQQRERIRVRPDLRDEPRRPPEVWQRGIPILNHPGRTS